MDEWASDLCSLDYAYGWTLGKDGNAPHLGSGFTRVYYFPPDIAEGVLSEVRARMAELMELVIGGAVRTVGNLKSRLEVIMSMNVKTGGCPSAALQCHV